MKPDADFEADECTVIDGSGAVLGRLASDVASRVLDGEKVAVVNAEEIVVSGEEDEVVEEYRQRDELGSDRGPYHPKRPDGIAKRSVRGMVPYKRERGKEALSNLRFYVGVPDEYDDADTEEFDATGDKLGRGGYVSLGEISQRIGANVTW
ncbi:MAG: 50S ribosomal protein L13 [Halobacteria archaeon]|nr:50S ribosomal protein L13 [Halobacteria archaeon]